MLKRGKHHCIHLQRAYNKDGAAAFKFQIIKECEAPNLEMAESIDHIKKAQKGNIISPEQRQRFSQKLKVTCTTKHIKKGGTPRGNLAKLILRKLRQK